MIEMKGEKILSEVLNYVNDDVNIIDAFVHFSEVHGIEIDVIASIIRKNPTIKGKIHDVAESLKLVEKSDKLPI